MGKATVTFEDDGDEVKCTFHFDPPLDLENNIATDAQLIALEKFQQLQRMAAEEDSDAEVAVEFASGRRVVSSPGDS